jgi:signal transduction histidine kinase/CheY-like chemotaxis protein
VLVLAPTARDADATRTLLAAGGVEAFVCESLCRLCRETADGAAALLLTEEALRPDGLESLLTLLGRQPPWSDLPVLVLTRGGADSERAVVALEELGNVTLLDRPVRVAILLSAVKTAMRSRLRQYQLQEHLAEQERAREALREADRRKDEFLAMLAHELRTPLASIVTAGAVLGAVADSPAVLRQQAVIDRQSRHTARLLDDLLDVSRITQGRIELRKQRLDLAEVVEQAATGCRPSLEEKGHRFTVSLPSEPLYAEADPARLEQIVSNLLVNAAKYTPPGGQVTLSLTRERAEAVLRVRDTGGGISPELLPRVFDLFTQAKRSLARAEGGVGIGLTLVKRLAELHGGAVLARSEGPDLGSEFEVRLPILADAGAGRTDQAPASTRLPPASCIPQPSKKVLLVEDNRDAAETMAELLELWGHEVCVASCGEDGLSAAETFQPGIVLLDIGLPGMDGYEVARRLRAAGLCHCGGLVALTGYGQEEDRRRSHEAGFDHHFTKPVALDALHDLLLQLGSGNGARP